MVSELFVGKLEKKKFGVCRKFEEKYWAATFPVNSENLGVEYIENN